MKKLLLISMFAIIGLSTKAQWQTTAGGPFGVFSHVYCLTTTGNTIFAGCNWGILSSNDVGNTWTFLDSASLISIATNGNVAIGGKNGQNLTVSINTGGSWSPWSLLNTGNSASSFAIKGRTIYAGLENNLGVAKSTDNGTTWSSMSNGFQGGNVESLILNDTNLYAGTDGGVMLFSNYHNSWSLVNTGMPTTAVYALAMMGTNIFAGTTSGIYISTNNGGSWTAVNTGLTDTNVLTLAVSGKSIFAGTGGGGVFLSTNNGNSWSAVNTGWATPPQIFTLAVFGTNLLAGTQDSLGVCIRPLLQMIDCAASYSTTYNSITNNFTLTVDPVTTATAISYLWDFGDGTTSTLASPPSHIYYMDTVYNVCLKIHTASGDSCEYCHNIGKDYFGNTYRTTAGFTLNVVNNATTLEVPNNSSESSISIYPNPFTSQTIISFSEIQKNTTIKIMDMMGRMINDKLLMVNGKSATLDMGGYAKGVYFVQIIDVNKNVVNKKIVMQ